MRIVFLREFDLILRPVTIITFLRVYHALLFLKVTPKLLFCPNGTTEIFFDLVYDPSPFVLRNSSFVNR